MRRPNESAMEETNADSVAFSWRGEGERLGDAFGEGDGDGDRLLAGCLSARSITPSPSKATGTRSQSPLVVSTSRSSVSHRNSASRERTENGRSAPKRSMVESFSAGIHRSNPISVGAKASVFLEVSKGREGVMAGRS
jgi:hypothetical protein